MRQALECCHKGWGDERHHRRAPAPAQEITHAPLPAGHRPRVEGHGLRRRARAAPTCRGSSTGTWTARSSIDELITHTMPLERINEAFDLMHAGESHPQRRAVLRRRPDRSNCSRAPLLRRRAAASTATTRAVLGGPDALRRVPAARRPAPAAGGCRCSTGCRASPAPRRTSCIKAGAQRLAAELGLMLVAPDTSPRGDGRAGRCRRDLGLRRTAPASTSTPREAALGRALPHVQLRDAASCRRWSRPNLPIERRRQRHLRPLDGRPRRPGGCALRHPGRYRSVSAFAPICAPIRVPLGPEGLRPAISVPTGRLGGVGCLPTAGGRHPLRGPAGEPLHAADRPGHGRQVPRASSCKPEALEAAAAAAGQPLTLRRQEGYDHSYFFIADLHRRPPAPPRRGPDLLRCLPLKPMGGRVENPSAGGQPGETRARPSSPP